MDICIIGGGASSFVCAIKASQRGHRVTIIEKNNNPLKKLLLTGNGRCNYFNSEMDASHYRCTNIDFLNEIINSNNINKTLNFFEEIGVVPRIKNGYYYPYSNTATTIKNLLMVEAKRLNINIKTNTLVTDIIYNNKFIIKTDSEDIKCDKVVIATGSNASIKNEEYNIYKILEKFGHTIIKPVPALVMLEGKEKYFNDWAGIRSDAVVSLYEEDNFVCSYEGEVQLTNYGISGICVMNLSGRVARGLLKNKKEVLRINFMPNIEYAFEYLIDRSESHKNLTIVELLESIVNYKLLYVILKKNNINPDKKWDELSYEEKHTLAKELSSFELNITGTKGIENAQVVSGGVSLNEVNNDFSSKIVSNLYLIGEVLDVDGDCGGYNLGFAFMSGLIVGEEI